MADIKELKMTRREQNEVLQGISNSGDSHEKVEIIKILIDNMTSSQKKKAIESIEELYPSMMNLVLLENGLIEEE